MNPREHGELISDALGAEDGGRTAEAFTRFFQRSTRGGWNSLTYDDFAPLEDAIADAYGRPRPKRQNRVVWKLKFWWHWHVTSPIIYPILAAPGDAWRSLAWHGWRKRRSAASDRRSTG